MFVTYATGYMCTELPGGHLGWPADEAHDIGEEWANKRSYT